MANINTMNQNETKFKTSDLFNPNFSVGEFNTGESAWERELRETGVNFSNALSNILPDLNKAWQATTATSVDMLKSVGGEDFADF